MGIQIAVIRFQQAPSWQALREAGEHIGGLPLQLTGIADDRCKIAFVAFEKHPVYLHFHHGELHMADYGQLSPVLFDVVHASACALAGVPRSMSRMGRAMPVTRADVQHAMREVRVISLVASVALLGALAIALALLWLAGHLAWQALS